MTSGAQHRKGYMQFMLQFSESLLAPSIRCSATCRSTTSCKSKYCDFNHLIQSVYEWVYNFLLTVRLCIYLTSLGRSASFPTPRLPHSLASQSSAATHKLLTQQFVWPHKEADWGTDPRGWGKEGRTYTETQKGFLFPSLSVHQADSLCTCTNIDANVALGWE